MRKKVLFVFNPYAGKGTIKNRLFEIINIITVKGYDVTVHPTQRRKEACELIIDIGKDFDILIVSGGDGTLNESVKGLLTIPKEDRPILGYLPSGSTNDFANSLSLLRQPIKAVECVFNGVQFECDMGKFCDDNFVYVAAFGAFTDVAYDTPQDMKNSLGHMAYILEGIKRISSITSHYMEIIYDGIEIKDEFIFGMVSNSTSIGGLKSFKKNTVDLSDGLFECVFIRMPKNPIELQAIITALIARDFTGNEILAFKAEKLNIKCEEELDWTLDGEYGGKYQEVVIENLHKELSIMVRADKQGADGN